MTVVNIERIVALMSLLIIKGGNEEIRLWFMVLCVAIKSIYLFLSMKRSVYFRREIVSTNPILLILCPL